MKIIMLLTILVPMVAFGWNNGQAGNARTNLPEECADPPYSTHDWIADKALDMLPDDEKEWLVPHRAMYLLGTEAPDNSTIHESCDSPHRGYGDTGLGHSVDWNSDHTAWALRDDGTLQDRAARRAQEEYGKAVLAFQQGNESDAAFFLGAMAHYIGDVSQYGHSGPFEDHHPDYEKWASHQSELNDTVFTPFLDESSLVRRTPYTAVKRISKATSGGKDDILSFAVMDANYANRNSDPDYLASTGNALNMAANELADVLHTFFLNVVDEN